MSHTATLRIITRRTSSRDAYDDATHNAHHHAMHNYHSSRDAHHHAMHISMQRASSRASHSR
eukprot:2788001-Pyramimonas_sp.AAC.1